MSETCFLSDSGKILRLCINNKLHIIAIVEYKWENPVFDVIDNGIQLASFKSEKDAKAYLLELKKTYENSTSTNKTEKGSVKNMIQDSELSNDGLVLIYYDDIKCRMIIQPGYQEGIFDVYIENSRHNTRNKIATFLSLGIAKDYLQECKRNLDNSRQKEGNGVSICEVIRKGFENLTETIMAELKKSLTFPRDNGDVEKP